VQAATATRRSIFARGPVVVFLVLAYVGVLHYAYVQDIAPIFTYLQYGYRAPDPFYYGAAIGMSIILALLLPRHLERPSHLIVWVLYLIAVLPGLIVPQISPALSQVEAFQLALWVAGCFLPVVLFGTRQALRGFIPLVKMSQRRWWLLVGAVWLVLTTFVIAYAGIKLTLPSFEDVYGVRGDFRVTESSDPALAYVVPLLDKVIDPLMIIRGLWYRRWTWAAAGTLGQVYLYSQQGSKTAILAPVAIVVAYLYLRSRRPVGPTILAAAVVGSIGVLLLDWWNASNTLTSDFVRRVLVTPGIVLSGYVQVFQDIPKAKLGYSVLRDFFPYTYAKEPPDLVGADFFRDPFTHANASWLADGYANFGYPGMIAATAVLILLLWAIDDATRGLPRRFACLVFLMPGLALAESAILTALLTHGFIAAIILCALAPRDGWPDRRSADAPVPTAAGSEVNGHRNTSPDLIRQAVGQDHPPEVRAAASP
jgi:hypothetical protein